MEFTLSNSWTYCTSALMEEMISAAVKHLKSCRDSSLASSYISGAPDVVEEVGEDAAAAV
jgi:hypothetical protein